MRTVLFLFVILGGAAQEIRNWQDFDETWLPVENGELSLSSAIVFIEGEYHLLLELENQGTISLCVLKGDLQYEPVWNERMIALGAAGQRLKYRGLQGGGVPVPRYHEMQRGDRILLKYNLKKIYGFVGGELSTRNFISYGFCNDVEDKGLMLEDMNAILASSQDIKYSKRLSTFEAFMKNGGKYADTGLVKHALPMIE